MEDKDVEKIVARYLVKKDRVKRVTPANALSINKARHVNERRMAWASLLFMMLLTLVAVFVIPPEHIGNYDTLFTNLFFALSGVVLGYMGFTTWGANKTFDTVNSNPESDEEENAVVTTTTTTAASNQEPAG